MDWGEVRTGVIRVGFFLMIRRPPRSTQGRASAASDVYKRQAQDTTAYGIDRGEKDGLPDLIEKILSAAPDIPRIRVLYAFPGFVSDRLIDLLSNNERVLPYLDIPLQHAHPEAVSYTHLRAHETVLALVCRLMLEKKNLYSTSVHI